MDGRWRGRRRSLLGSLVLAVYLAGGLGPAGGALAALWHDGPGAQGACGCAEGAACCGAACCAPAPAAADAGLPDCCRDVTVEAAPSCCDAAAGHPAARDPGQVAGPAGVLALVSRCTCGHRDHQSSFAHVLDAHVPMLGRAGICPPPVAVLAPGNTASVATWRPEPRDRVPKSSRPVG